MLSVVLHELYSVISWSGHRFNINYFSSIGIPIIKIICSQHCLIFIMEIRYLFTSIVILILKMRWSFDRLIFKLGILILVGRRLYILNRSTSLCYCRAIDNTVLYKPCCRQSTMPATRTQPIMQINTNNDKKYWYIGGSVSFYETLLIIIVYVWSPLSRWSSRKDIFQTRYHAMKCIILRQSHNSLFIVCTCWRNPRTLINL